MQHLRKIEAPKNLKQKDLQRASNTYSGQASIRDWAGLARTLQIPARVQAMSELSMIIERQIQTRREGKMIKKELMNRGGSQNKPDPARADSLSSSFSDSDFQNQGFDSQVQFGDSSNLDIQRKNSKFPYPFCLSSIILRLQDILHNPKIVQHLKEEQRAEILRLIQLCLQEQKSLIYMMPFFVLNFLICDGWPPPPEQEQNVEGARARCLKHLKFVTKGGRVVNKGFSSKLFLVVLHMIDVEALRDGGMTEDFLHQILEFMEAIFDYNPDCFNATQTLILLTRICLIGFIAMTQRLSELSYKVLQSVQFLLKYNKNSSTHNMQNLALLALTIMATDHSQKLPVWNIVKYMMSLDPDRIVYEVLEILMIGNNSTGTSVRPPFNDPYQSAPNPISSTKQSIPPPPGSYPVDNTFMMMPRIQEARSQVFGPGTGSDEAMAAGTDQSRRQPNSRSRHTSQPDQNLRELNMRPQSTALANNTDNQINEELYSKCFNQERNEFKLDLEEIENDLKSKHKSCLINPFKELDPLLSIEELICKLECPNFFINPLQEIQIIEFDMLQLNSFRQTKLQKIKERVVSDRQELIEKLEEDLDLVKWGAVYFMGMTLYGPDNVQECTYSMSRILEVFRLVLMNTKNYQLINEIILSINQLLHNKIFCVSIEWDQILDIIETLFKYHSQKIIIKKGLGDIDRIFKYAQDQIVLDSYQRDEVRVLKLYVQVRQESMRSEGVQNLDNRTRAHQKGAKLPKEKGIPAPNMVLLSLYIDYVLTDEFSNLENLIDNLYLKETNVSVQMLVMEKLHQFYKDYLGNLQCIERLERVLLYTFIEVLQKQTRDPATSQLSNRLQASKSLPPSEGFHQSIVLKSIDMLAFMAYKTRNSQNFQDMINILYETLMNKKTFENQSLFHQTHSNFVNQSQLLLEEMNASERQCIKRLVQIFKLTSTSTESFKAISILNLLLETFKNDTIEKRNRIMNEIILNIKINKKGDLCWVAYDYPLMIGFKEFYRINHCDMCKQDPNDYAEFDQDQLKELQELSHEMVIPLQHYVHALLSQLNLSNEEQSILDFKIQCLQQTKQVLLDIYSSEDAFHQSIYQEDPDHANLDGRFDIGRVCMTLISFVDINRNFDCSKQIFEILFIMIGSQTYEKSQISYGDHPPRLQLTVQQHSDMLRCIIESLRESYMKYCQNKKDSEFNRKELMERLQNILFDSAHDSDSNPARKSTVVVKQKKKKNRVEPEPARQTEAAPSSHKDTGLSQMANKKDLENSSHYEPFGTNQLAHQSMHTQATANIQDSVQTLDFLDMCQRTLSLLGYFLHCDCSQLELDEQTLGHTTQQNSQRNDPYGFRTVHSTDSLTLSKIEQKSQMSQNSIMKNIIELLYQFCKNDQTLHHVSFQVLSVLQGITYLIKKKHIQAPFAFQMVQLLLYRVAVPKIIIFDDPFTVICQKWEAHFNKDWMFLKDVLFSSTRQADPSDNIFAYQQSPQSQILLDVITSIQINTFNLTCDFSTFEVLQDFIRNIQTQFDNWHDNQVIEQNSQGIQYNFLNNLADFLQWTKHSNQGGLKRHLKLESYGYDGDKTQFFILNHSLIEVNRLQNDLNKFKILIRNSAYNLSMIYEINNPQQDIANNNSDQNKKLMRQYLNKEVKKDSEASDLIEIDQYILFQAINPIIMNQMKRDRHLFQVTDSCKTMCKRVCAQLDKLAPFNMNFVFVSSFYTDGETALDFMSRLGNFECLKGYMHYFQDNDVKTQEYISTLNGVVYDKDLSDIYIFISDILSDPNQSSMDYNLLQTIKHLQTIFLGSTQVLKDKCIPNLSESQIQSMQQFMSSLMREQERLPLRIFRLNSKEYIISENLSAQCHEQDRKDIQKSNIFNHILCVYLRDSRSRYEPFDDALRSHDDSRRAAAQNRSLSDSLRPADSQTNKSNIENKPQEIQYEDKNGVDYLKSPEIAPSKGENNDGQRRAASTEDGSNRDEGALLMFPPEAPRGEEGPLYRQQAHRAISKHPDESKDSAGSETLAFDDTRSGGNSLKQTNHASQSLQVPDTSQDMPNKNAPTNAISDILQCVPDMPICDNMIIKNDQIGHMIRYCIKQHRHFNQQYSKEYRTPNMLQRSRILQGLIKDIKYSEGGKKLIR